jgi:PAS domain S-box-containing protein
MRLFSSSRTADDFDGYTAVAARRKFRAARLGVGRRMVGRLFAITWLLLTWAGPGARAQPAKDAPRALRVVTDDKYAPYSFRAGDGELRGILVDQWRAWEKQTGRKVEIHAVDWSEALRRMEAGEFDVIDEIVETPGRRERFDFTAAYAVIEVPIFFRDDISGITDLASLKGFPVGVKQGDQHIDRLVAGGVTNLILFPNYEAMIEAARQQKINVFVADAPSALYLLNKAGIEAKFRKSAPLFRDGLQRAVRKGDAATLREVEEGFAALEPALLERIDDKWFGHAINWYGPYLAYASYGLAGIALLVAILVAWNHTLRKKIQQRTADLSESEQRFRQIAENLHEVVWLTTADWRTTLYVSPAYETVWGRSRQSLYDDSRSFFTVIHPDDRPRVTATIEAERLRGFAVEYRLLRADGSVRRISDRGFPIRDEVGRVYRVGGIAEDITERKQAAEVLKAAEDRVRLIIDTMPIMAWSLRADGVVDFLNQRWMDYAGLTLEEFGKDPARPIHPDDLARVMAKWAVDMAAGEPCEDEMRLRRADGEYRWFLVRTAPLRDAQGRIVRWFGSSLDIEDRKVAVDALRRSEHQLQALVARLTTVREEEAKRIARELHDDLGQKLTALTMGLSELELKLAEPPASQRARIAHLHTTVDRTVEAVQELASELRLGQLDVLGLTAAVEWQLKEFSRRSGIPCAVTRLDEITGLSEARSTAAFRILQEALTNIVRHAGATRVEVSLQAGPGQLALSIRDNGHGVATTDLHDREALGLLGMRERAAGVGGVLTITGVPGEGTTVLVTIPLIQNDGASA